MKPQRLLMTFLDESPIFRSWQEGRSRASLVITCLALIALVSLVDHLTGRYLAFSLFYLVPISLAAWAGSRRLALLLSVICAVMWGLIDYQAGMDYPHFGYEVWNASIRLAFFFITTFLLSGLRAAYQREQTLARIDGLTGGLNRRSFVMELEAAIVRATKDGTPLSVAYCDLDDFKAVNDTQGHAAGDAVLCDVVRVAKQQLGPGEIIGRLGGDEFALLLPGADELHARERCAGLLAAWRASMGGQGWPTDVSMGLATFTTAPVSADAALHAADEFARQVKAVGKGGLHSAAVEARVPEAQRQGIG